MLYFFILSHIPTLVCSSSMFITATIMMLPFVFFVLFENFTVLNYSFLVIVYLAKENYDL